MAKNLSCTQCNHYWIIAYKAVFVEVEYSASGGSFVATKKQNYPVNLGAPERTVKFSFQRVVGSNKKNVTPLVIFNLMLKMMQEDELWIK